MMNGVDGGISEEIGSRIVFLFLFLFPLPRYLPTYLSSPEGFGVTSGKREYTGSVEDTLGLD